VFLNDQKILAPARRATVNESGVPPRANRRWQCLAHNFNELRREPVVSAATNAAVDAMAGCVHVPGQVPSSVGGPFLLRSSLN